MSTTQIQLTKARQLFNEKKFESAVALLNQITPDTKEDLHQKYVLESAILIRTGEVEASLERIHMAEECSNGETEATLNIKAIAYRAQNDLLKAKNALEQGLVAHPNSVDIAHNLSVTAADMGDFDLAIKAGVKALAINPKYIETYKNLGRVYVTQRDVVKAKELFTQLNAIQPNSVDVLVGFGAIELIDSNASKAKVHFEKALQKDDSLSAAWANLGICHKYLGNFASAKKCLETASTKDPKQVEHIWNLSLINLALANFKIGWEQYEIRYDARRIATDAVKLPNTRIPMLRPGDAVQGKVVILVQEQGYGDTFQFFRFAKQLKDEGARKIIAIVSPEMAEIVRTIPWIDEVRSEMKQTTEMPDYWVFSMSLPLRYGVHSIETIPVHTSYLSVDRLNQAKWVPLLATDSNKLRVGLVWAGRETHSNDANRSLNMKLLEPILAMHEQIEFISLQKGVREADIAGDARIQSYGSKLNNFADTAALLSNLDLLISVDSSPVHLAGALGMPVWTLIPSICDFRWLLDREDSPWYPSMRLFRQKKGQGWDQVIKRIQAELETLIQKNQGRWQADEYTLFPSLALGNSHLAGVPFYLNCAFQYHIKGELDAAKAMYEKCLKYEPNSLDALRNLAALHRNKGELREAEDLYIQGDKLGIGDPIFYTNYANLLINLQRFNEAVQKAEAALNINPGHEPAKALIKQHSQLQQ